MRDEVVVTVPARDEAAALARYDPHRDGEQILADWERFLRSGFRYEAFTPLLHRHLVWSCGYSARLDRRRFWQRYFAGSLERLQRFLAQFARRGPCPESGDGELWLSDDWAEAASVNRAMCAVMEPVYPALTRVLVEAGRPLYEVRLSHFLMGLLPEGLDGGALAAWWRQEEAAYRANVPVEEAAPFLEVTPLVRVWLARAARPAARFGLPEAPSPPPEEAAAGRPPRPSGIRPWTVFEAARPLAGATAPPVERGSPSRAAVRPSESEEEAAARRRRLAAEAASPAGESRERRAAKEVEEDERAETM